MDDRLPETQPAGALVPPPRVPPGAVATAAPLPPRPPRADDAGRVARRTPFALLNGVLDRLDELADRIASAAGLR